MTEPVLEFKEDLEEAGRLNRRTVLFIAEYLATNSVKAASEAAGYKSVKYDLLKVPEVIEVIAAERLRQLNSLEVTAKRVLEELARIAFMDVGSFFNEDGSPRPIDELSQDARRCIAGIDYSVEYRGRDDDRRPVAELKKIRLVDKKGALELLGKYLKLFTDKVEVTGMDSLAERLAEARMNAGRKDEPGRSPEGA